MHGSDLYRAVIFDLGGVVLPSPFEAWAEYEREVGVEVGFIRRLVAASGEDGAWARHERGELSFEEFLRAFDAECAAAGAPRISGAEVMGRLTAGAGPRPEMLRAVERIREEGLRTAALTNNWVAPEGEDRRVDVIGALFDVVVESAVEGLRKPDPEIYRLTCDRLAIEPPEAVFLDDLGMNLKPARELGMTTIKVDDPTAALEELEDTLGFSLR